MLYLVKSPLLIGLKVGRWKGSYCKLRARYVTPYGKAVDVVVFSCDASLSAEQDLFAVLRKSHDNVLSGELFKLQTEPVFYDYCARTCHSSFSKLSPAKAAFDIPQWMQFTFGKERQYLLDQREAQESPCINGFINKY